MGRISSDTVRLFLVTLVVILVGLLVGFRFEGGLLAGAMMIVTAVAFGWAMSWIMANIGLRVKDPETAQTAGFVWLFPLSFISSVFTPVTTMPAWLQPIARNNPVTLIANLVRGFSMGQVTMSMVVPAVLWIVGITVVFAPLAVRRYRTV